MSNTLSTSTSLMPRPISPKHIFLIAVFALATIAASAETVFVLPLRQQIDAAAARHVSRGCAQALEHGADIILLDLNTYGGELDAADSIRTLLMRQSVPTVAFVNENAASAGALIALACDSVFMAPGSSMGAATVVNSQGEALPQKYQSYMQAIMQATAEHHGKLPDGTWRRNPAIAHDMVAPDHAVAFTPSQAVAEGYADGVAPSMAAVVAQLNIPSPTYIYYESALSDDILGFLASGAVKAVLIMLILGGLYMEMHSPGLGFAGAVASVSAVLYLLPMLVLGTIPAWVLITFIAGVILFALEIFVVPGFGITGVSGIAAIVVSLIGAAVSSDAVTGYDLPSIGNAVITTGIGAALALALCLYLTSSRGPKFLRRHASLETELKNSDGFIGVDMGPARLVGKHGTAVTDLRPAGKIEIGTEVYDAVSTGPYIDLGAAVKAVRFENAQLYVVKFEKSTHSSHE